MSRRLSTLLGRVNVKDAVELKFVPLERMSGEDE